MSRVSTGIFQKAIGSKCLSAYQKYNYKKIAKSHLCLTPIQVDKISPYGSI